MSKTAPKRLTRKQAHLYVRADTGTGIPTGGVGFTASRPTAGEQYYRSGTRVGSARSSSSRYDGFILRESQERHISISRRSIRFLSASRMGVLVHRAQTKLRNTRKGLSASSSAAGETSWQCQIQPQRHVARCASAPCSARNNSRRSPCAGRPIYPGISKRASRTAKMVSPICDRAPSSTETRMDQTRSRGRRVLRTVVEPRLQQLAAADDFMKSAFSDEKSTR